MMKDQCHCPGSVRVHRQDHSVRLKSRHLLVPANAYLGLCVLTFERLKTKTGMKHSTFNLCKTKKNKSGDFIHNGSTPVAAGVCDKYGTGQILQEQVRLKDKIFSTFAVK